MKVERSARNIGTYVLFTLILFFITALIPILGLVFFVLIITQISLSVRRLHDIGMSGWWALLFIPLSIPMLIVGFIDSAPDNQYGANPKKRSDSASFQTKNTEERYTENYGQADAQPKKQSQSSDNNGYRRPLKDFN